MVEEQRNLDRGTGRRDSEPRLLELRASCPNSAAPSIRTFNSHELKIYFGDLRCKISLMGQDTPLFGLKLRRALGLVCRASFKFFSTWDGSW